MVSEAQLNKDVNALMSKYVKLYTEAHGEGHTFNRYREKWGFRSMIDDLGTKRAFEILEYYFQTTRPDHPTQYLFNNYDRFDEIDKERREDEVLRARLLKETEERVKNWSEQIGDT